MRKKSLGCYYLHVILPGKEKANVGWISFKKNTQDLHKFIYELVNYGCFNTKYFRTLNHNPYMKNGYDRFSYTTLDFTPEGRGITELNLTYLATKIGIDLTYIEDERISIIPPIIRIMEGEHKKLGAPTLHLDMAKYYEGSSFSGQKLEHHKNELSKAADIETHDYFQEAMEEANEELYIDTSFVSGNKFPIIRSLQ